MDRAASWSRRRRPVGVGRRWSFPHSWRGGGSVMRTYVLQRLLQLVPVLFFLSVIVFAVVRLIPGDPAAMRLGDAATPDAVALLRHDMGLDQPIPFQYALWLGN